MTTIRVMKPINNKPLYIRMPGGIFDVLNYNCYSGYPKKPQNYCGNHLLLEYECPSTKLNPRVHKHN